MCGRTIRVPLLDGSVEPLPAPELNLQDGGLASALDKLAALVADPEDRAAVQREPAASSPAPLRSVADDAPRPIPLPEPIALPPAPKPVAVDSIPETPPQRGHAAEGGPSDPLASLQSLAEAQGPAAPFASGRSAPRRAPGLLPMGVAAVLLSVVSFFAGFGAGRLSVPATVEKEGVRPADAVTVVGPEPPPAAGVDNAGPVLVGRISYVDAEGEVRPDAGARILIVPEERSGSSRLATEGFRAGANDADRDLAIASIRAVGGDFVIADADGSYAATLPAAGLYQVLIVSRYQARAEGEAPDATAIQVLANYFDRPAQVIGESALHVSQFRYRGSGASTRDQTFERP